MSALALPSHPAVRALLIVLLTLAIFVPRLYDLGRVLTVDEPLWQSRSAQFIKGVASGHFDQTLVAGQPGVTTAWVGGMVARFHSLAASQAAIGISTGVLILICTYFLVQLWGWQWGMVAGAVLGLQPFLLGHSRVLHTDALVALFSLASILALLVGLASLRARQLISYRYIVYSGAFAAGALLTKILGVFLIPTAVGMICYHCWRYRQSLPQVVRLLGIWLTVLVVVVWVAWPALWLHSDRVSAYLFERGALHAGGTREEEATSLPWYYLREIPFRLTTLGSIFIPFGIAALALVRRSFPLRWSMAWLLLAASILLAMLSLAGDKSDRYVLFCIIIFELLGVVGMAFIAQAVPRPIQKRLGFALIAIVVVWLGLDAARLQPYYLAYYNRLYPLEDTHKLGWGEGLELAADWILKQNPQAKVATYYPRVFDYFYPGEVVSITHVDDANPDYVVLYRSMFERGPNAEETDIIHRYLAGALPAAHVIEINGMPYVWIFTVLH